MAPILALLILPGCSMLEIFGGDLPSRKVPVFLPSASAPKAERLLAFEKYQLYLGSSGLVFRHREIRYWEREDFVDAFRGTGLRALAEDFPRRSRRSQWREVLGGVCLAVGVNYVLFSPLQNVRDNTIWRDASLIGVPVAVWAKVGMRGIEDAKTEAAFAQKFNQALLEHLELNRGDLDLQEQEHRFTLPEK